MGTPLRFLTGAQAGAFPEAGPTGHLQAVLSLSEEVNLTEGKSQCLLRTAKLLRRGRGVLWELRKPGEWIAPSHRAGHEGQHNCIYLLGSYNPVACRWWKPLALPSKCNSQVRNKQVPGAGSEM